MRQASLIRLSAVVAVLVLGATCDEPSSKVPTSPGAATILALDLQGPDTIAPGQSAQFNAVARLSDGSTKIATYLPDIRWRAGVSSLLTVNSSGLVTASQRVGDGFVSADLPGDRLLRGTNEVVVVPHGTYRIVGRVAEVEYPTAYIADARVEVNPGALVTTTRSNGEFKLHGVPSDAEIRISAPGYQPLVERLQLNQHVNREFRLPLAERRLSLDGSYTLTLELVGGCLGSPPLPVDLRRRSYEATATQNGADVTVTLTEPRFKLDGAPRGNFFRGRAESGRVVFSLTSFYNYYYYYYGPVYPDIVEQLPDGTYLVPAGSAIVTGSPDRVSGDLDGVVSNYDSRFPNRGTNVLSSCEGRYRFTLTRR